MSRSAHLRDLPFDLDLHRDDRAPMHKILYDALRGAMLGGRIGPGSRLPSSRDLAAQLGVARGTVVSVYAQLASEGYLAARVGSGTVVAEELPDAWFRSPEGGASRRGGRAEAAVEVPLSRWGRGLTRSPFSLHARQNPRPFRPHVPALDLFPTDVWGKLVARRARRDEALLLGDGDVAGYAPLRAALAEHLRTSRGVACSERSLVIVPSVQQVLDIVARLALDPGDAVWVEDPGYTGARSALLAASARLVPVPVDEQGLDVAAGIRRAKDARMAYVTPGHQAPLGSTMTIERRLALLSWAKASRALVLEDDYDSEYRYEGRPVSALQGLDRAGVVLHTGTFSKTLLPSLRLSYVAVPEGLIDRFLAAKSIVDRYTPPLQQAALADFLAEGHFARHLRRMREAYAGRRAALLDALDRELGDEVEILGASAGLEVAVRFRSLADDRVLSEALAAASIEAPALSTHSIERGGPQGLLLGFAAFSPARLRRSVSMLAAVLRGLPRAGAARGPR